MEAGGSLQIVGREHTPTYMEESRPGPFIPDGKANRVEVESSMSIWKQEYLAKKAVGLDSESPDG